jgi:GT2 family glycosyltransferase
MPSRWPNVATVVLNYRCEEDTLACVRALRTSTMLNQRLIVVDNAALGAEHDRLRARLDDRVTVLASGGNLGYAAGNNVGISAALPDRPDFFFIVNPDVEVTPDALEALLTAAEEVPEAGVIGARIVHGSDSPARLLYDGGVVDTARFGATSHLHMGRLLDDLPRTGVRDTDYVTGAGMLVRRSVIRHVGLLPEEYFLYFEETEFCLRVQQAGWRTVIADDALLRHHKRSSGALPTPYYVYYMTRNRLHFARRHFNGDVDVVLEDFRRSFLDPWRERVLRHAPGWVDQFDLLVAEAVSDARAGTTGRSTTVDTIAPPLAAVASTA